MWIMTTRGFFSAVEDRDDRNIIMVRARVRKDLLELRKILEVPPKKRPLILETPDADYPFRIRIPRQAWADVIAKMAGGIDYDNFKDAVKEKDPARADVYLTVWSNLRARLGGGRCGVGDEFDDDYYAPVVKSKKPSWWNRHG
jgi:hypothetical protein